MVSTSLAKGVAAPMFAAPVPPENLSAGLVIASAVALGFVAALSVRLLRGLPSRAPSGCREEGRS